jgi:hypothetical protein
VDTDEVFGTIYGVACLVLGAMYAIVGVRFYLRFKSASPERFREMRCRIMTSIIVISTLFFLRGSLNAVLYLTDFNRIELPRSLEQGTMIYPMFITYYFFGKFILVT